MRYGPTLKMKFSLAALLMAAQFAGCSRPTEPPDWFAWLDGPPQEVIQRTDGIFILNRIYQSDIARYRYIYFLIERDAIEPERHMNVPFLVACIRRSINADEDDIHIAFVLVTHISDGGIYRRVVARQTEVKGVSEEEIHVICSQFSKSFDADRGMMQRSIFEERITLIMRPDRIEVVIDDVAKRGESLRLYINEDGLGTLDGNVFLESDLEEHENYRLYRTQMDIATALSFDLDLPGIMEYPVISDWFEHVLRNK